DLGNYRLTGAELFVTKEPCLMCFGAAIHARLSRVVFGASDPRLGASRTIEELGRRRGALNHALRIEGGIESEACAGILREFFETRRREGAFAAAAREGEWSSGEVPKWS